MYLSSQEFEEFKGSFDRRYAKFKNFKEADSVYKEELENYKKEIELTLSNNNLPSEIDESPELTKVISSTEDEELRSIESHGPRLN